MLSETIYWRNAHEVLPQDDKPVIIETALGFHFAFLLNGVWRNARFEIIPDPVLAWCDYPIGLKRLPRRVPEAATVIKTLQESLAWFIAQFRGDSGTGEEYWQQFPEYKKAVLLLRNYQPAPSLDHLGLAWPNSREATKEELAPVLKMADAALMLAGASANGKLAAIHANTHGASSILVLQFEDLIWGYRIALPTREQRKAESRRMIQAIAEKNGWKIAPLDG
jgi:hypothetical protein